MLRGRSKITGTNIFLNKTGDLAMNSLIGLVVGSLAILSFLGLR